MDQLLAEVPVVAANSGALFGGAVSVVAVLLVAKLGWELSKGGLGHNVFDESIVPSCE